MSSAKERSPGTHRAAAIIGWSGTVSVLIAYALITFGTFTAESVVYQLLNVGGAFGLSFLAFVKGAWPAVALNAVWAGIGIASLIT